MAKKFIGLFVLIRPRQWLKNAALFLPLIFSGRLFSLELLEQTLYGAIAFCFLSSSNYILNDILDVARDRKDPFKKNRPIAAGVIPVPLAGVVAFIFLAIGFSISRTLAPAFLLVAVGFVVLHWLSHFFLRRIPVIDVLALATGYLLRISAGEIVSGTHMSVWLFLSMLAFSLLVAIGKRRAELSIIKMHEDQFSRNPEEFIYSERLLDAYVTFFANATFLTYSYFAFLAGPAGGGGGLLADTGAWSSRKWMMLSIPFVLYGILRYLQIIYEIKDGVLERVILGDKPLLLSLLLWGIVVVAVVYWL